jgi:hypothetical protein
MLYLLTDYIRQKQIIKIANIRKIRKFIFIYRRRPKKGELGELTKEQALPGETRVLGCFFLPPELKWD